MLLYNKHPSMKDVFILKGSSEYKTEDFTYCQINIRILFVHNALSTSIFLYLPLLLSNPFFHV